jgi:hypothetical protein
VKTCLLDLLLHPRRQLGVDGAAPRAFRLCSLHSQKDNLTTSISPAYEPSVDWASEGREGPPSAPNQPARAQEEALPTSGLASSSPVDLAASELLAKVCCAAPRPSPIVRVMLGPVYRSLTGV